MLMIRYTIDREKADARARQEMSTLPDPSHARVICCNEDATIQYMQGILRITGSDVNFLANDVNYISATIVNDKQD